ncbi:hypothetical protein B0H14DRAFT_2280411, partial [Mycena olivaceomarginata]
VMHKYDTNYRDTAEDKEQLLPQIFQLANNAYYHMHHTTQDQVIIFTKSENCWVAIKALLELSVSVPGK